MAACGCGFNHDGERVRACKTHTKVKAKIVNGERIKTAKPKDEKRDQSKYYKKYKTEAYQKLKAAGKTGRGRQVGTKVTPGLKRARRKSETAAVAVATTGITKKVIKRVQSAVQPKPALAAPAKVAQSTADGVKKALKLARDARYRANKKARLAATEVIAEALEADEIAEADAATA